MIQEMGPAARQVMRAAFRACLWAALPGVFLPVATPQVRADWLASLQSSQAANYGLLFEGFGTNQLQITNVTVNGNIGVGNTGAVQDSGPATINGRLDFSAGNTGQFHNNNSGNVGPTSVNYDISAVASALTDVNGFNSALGGEAGTRIAIGTGLGQTLTVNAGSGMLDANGNRVFRVTGFNTTNGDTLRIEGDGHSVVLNFVGLGANFNNQVALDNLSPDQVLYNFVGGSGGRGGPTLQINDNASGSPGNLVQGDFLNPNGPIAVVNSRLDGRVFGGDSHDMQFVSGSSLTVPAAATPEPTSLCLGLLTMGAFGVMRCLRGHRDAAR
jgi:PEP-CTERM motif